ncbi:unnamed protein product [Closterium sp. NIES-54]
MHAAGRIRVLNVVAAVAIVVILYYVGRPLYWELEARMQEYREGFSDATAAGTTGTAAQGGAIRPVGNARGAHCKACQKETSLPSCLLPLDVLHFEATHPLHSHTPVARPSLAMRAGLEAAALQGLPKEAAMALMALDVVDPDAAPPATPTAPHHALAGPVAAAESAGATGSGGADEAGAAEGEVGATEEAGAAGPAGAGGKEETPSAAGVSLDLPSDAPAAKVPALGTTAGEVHVGATSAGSSGADASGAGPFANGVRPILHEGRPLLPALKREIWEKPPAGSAVPARGEFALRREMVEQRQHDGVVVVTFANHAFLDFVLNWVRHLTDLGVYNILVGAMDTKFLEALCSPSHNNNPTTSPPSPRTHGSPPPGAMDTRLLEALYGEGVPVFDLESGMTSDDPGWGTPVFHAMGREKVTLINVFLSLGVQLLICDTDTVWLRVRARGVVASPVRGV